MPVRVTRRNLPVMRPHLPKADALLPYLEQIDAARIYSNWGPLTDTLKRRLAHYFDLEPDRVTVLANGTLALQGAVQTAGHEGDAWTVPSWSFVASALAIAAAGRRVHFVDVDPDTWAAGPPASGGFAGSMAVAPFGDRPRVEQWQAQRTPTLFDAASCFDACRGIGPLLRPNTAVMISLHATKPLAAGEGAILLGDPDWIAEVERWANFGFAGDRITRAAGMNGKLSEYHAAVALASLDCWEADRARWLKSTRAVLDVSKRLGTRPQPALRDGWLTSTWICELPSAAVKVQLQRELAAAGIEFRDWGGSGIAAMPHFQSTPRDDLPVTAELAARTIGLPLFRDMEAAEIDDIAAVVAAVTGDAGEA